MPSELIDAIPDGEILRALVGKIPSMVAYWDSTRRCRFANRAYEQWFGVSPESLIGTHMRDLLGPLYPLNLPFIDGALGGAPQEFEREVPSPSGGPPRHALANYIPDTVGGIVRGFFVLVTDVSAIKRAEQALRQSEERFRLTIDEAPIGMALVAPGGRFIRLNRVLCEIVGYTEVELTALTLRTITHPEDLDADVALARQLERGEIPRYRLGKRLIRKDGTIVDVMLSGSALRDEDGTPTVYIAQIEDVTERKRLEDELRLAVAKYSGILSISADAIVSVDEWHRIALFNEGAERLFGYSRAEVIGLPLDMLIPERFRAHHRRHVEAFGVGGQAARPMGDRGMAILGRRKNGEEFPADAAISKLEVGGARVLTVALRDITEQRRIEREQQFLADVGPVLADTLDYEGTLSRIAHLAVRDIADLCVVEILEEGRDLRRIAVASRDPAKAWVCDLLMRIPLDRRRPHLMRSVFETKQSVLIPLVSPDQMASFAQDEDHHRALAGADIRSMVAVPLQAHGRLLGAMGFLGSTGSRVYGPADVRLAEELAQRAALAIESARRYRASQRATQARDDVLGVVAHDLRNPLTVIRGHATLLRRRMAAGHAGSDKSAEVIERAALQMQRLIEDLLEVSRMEEGHLPVEPASAAAHHILIGSLDAHRLPAAEASIELRLDVQADLPDVWADHGRLVQVFDNLIGNALKFTPRFGVISVGAARQDRHVLFWVKDTGSGIAADHLPHVFDKFWQATKTGRRGAGLGLPIVKGIVEAHRGRLWVESTPGEGSTFYFTIPVSSSET